MYNNYYAHIVVIGSFRSSQKYLPIQTIYFSSILDLIMSLSGLKSSVIQMDPSTQRAPYYGHNQIFSI